MQGIHYWIKKWSNIKPDKIAMIGEDEQWTYKQLNEKVEGVLHFLREDLNVKKGDKIAILSQNSAEFIALLFAIAALQCVAVPLNVRLTKKELAYQINDSQTSYLFYEETFAEVSGQLAQQMKCQAVSMDRLASLKFAINVSGINYEVDENEPFIICYTSGTTGSPKGAVLTQNNMFYNALNNITAINITSDDRTIVLLPLFHIGGIGLFAFPTLFAGGTIVIAHKFDPDKVLQMLERERVTVVMGVPVMFQSMIDHPSFHQTDLSSVRLFYSGGAPCPIPLIQRYMDKGFTFGQGFGLTETSPTVFMLPIADIQRKMGSVGKPALFCDVKIVNESGEPVGANEVGHLLVKGNNVFKEYWNLENETKKAFQGDWFITGDLASMDEEGFVYIAGREKEMIISGGENIYPLEIEKVILSIEKIHEVAVIGMEDQKWGEVPVAFVVLKDGEIMTKEAILSYCENHLAKYKIPKRVHFLNELPRNSTGKIQKNKLVHLIER